MESPIRGCLRVLHINNVNRSVEQMDTIRANIGKEVTIRFEHEKAPRSIMRNNAKGVRYIMDSGTIHDVEVH